MMAWVWKSINREKFRLCFAAVSVDGQKKPAGTEDHCKATQIPGSGLYTRNTIN